jgi:hypothetical protein
MKMRRLKAEFFDRAKIKMKWEVEFVRLKKDNE